MPRSKNESSLDGQRLKALAVALAAREKITLPSKGPNSYTEAWPFLVVVWRDDPEEAKYDDGHGVGQIGSAEWAKDAQHAAELLYRKLEYYGWGDLSVYDVEGYEHYRDRCSVKVGVAMEYQALTTLHAVGGLGVCFDNAPEIGGARRKEQS